MCRSCGLGCLSCITAGACGTCTNGFVWNSTAAICACQTYGKFRYADTCLFAVECPP